MAEKTLKDSAAELRPHLEDFDVAELAERLRTLASETDALCDALEQDWTAFWEAANALIARAEAEALQLSAQARPAIEAVAALETEAREQAEELAESCNTAGGALGGLATGILDLQRALGAWTEDQVIAPSEQVAAEWEAVAAAMVGAVDAARAAIDTNLAEIEEHRVLSGQFGTATANVAHAGSQALVAIFEEWAGRIVGVVDLVRAAGFKPAAKHVPNAVKPTLEECEEHERESLSEAATAIKGAGDALLSLARESDRVAASVENTGRELDASLAALHSALTTSSDQLEAFVNYVGEHCYLAARSS